MQSFMTNEVGNRILEPGVNFHGWRVLEILNELGYCTHWSSFDGVGNQTLLVVCEKLCKVVYVIGCTMLHINHIPSHDV